MIRKDLATIPTSTVYLVLQTGQVWKLVSMSDPCWVDSDHENVNDNSLHSIKPPTPLDLDIGPAYVYQSSRLYCLALLRLVRM